jgi:hypothetical protein
VYHEVLRVDAVSVNGRKSGEGARLLELKENSLGSKPSLLAMNEEDEEIHRNQEFFELL